MGNDAEILSRQLGSCQTGARFVADEERIWSTEQARVQTDSVCAAVGATVECTRIQTTRPENDAEEETDCCDAITAETAAAQLYSTA